jgi:hypothetical protein
VADVRSVVSSWPASWYGWRWEWLPGGEEDCLGVLPLRAQLRPKRSVILRNDRLRAERPNHVWAFDFQCCGCSPIGSLDHDLRLGEAA